jgi:hypothetical protein
MGCCLKWLERKFPEENIDDHYDNRRVRNGMVNMQGIENNDLISRDQMQRFIMEQEKRPLAPMGNGESSNRDVRNQNDPANYNT